MLVTPTMIHSVITNVTVAGKLTICFGGIFNHFNSAVEICHSHTYEDCNQQKVITISTILLYRIKTVLRPYTVLRDGAT